MLTEEFLLLIVTRLTPAQGLIRSPWLCSASLPAFVTFTA
jgi:hypothetical protein